MNIITKNMSNFEMFSFYVELFALYYTLLLFYIELSFRFWIWILKKESL